MKQITIEDGVKLWAGTVILISVFLSLTVSPWWLCLTAFAGVNLIQSVFTGFCLAEIILKKMGMKHK